MRAHGIRDRQIECLARHGGERLTLLAAEADEIERDVDAAGAAHDIVQMLFDRLSIHGVDQGRGRDGAGLAQFPGQRRDSLEGPAGEKQLRTFARERACTALPMAPAAP